MAPFPALSVFAERIPRDDDRIVVGLLEPFTSHTLGKLTGRPRQSTCKEQQEKSKSALNYEPGPRGWRNFPQHKGTRSARWMAPASPRQSIYGAFMRNSRLASFDRDETQKRS